MGDCTVLKKKKFYTEVTRSRRLITDLKYTLVPYRIEHILFFKVANNFTYDESKCNVFATLILFPVVSSFSKTILIHFSVNLTLIQGHWIHCNNHWLRDSVYNINNSGTMCTRYLPCGPWLSPTGGCTTRRRKRLVIMTKFYTFFKSKNSKLRWKIKTKILYFFPVSKPVCGLFLCIGYKLTRNIFFITRKNKFFYHFHAKKYLYYIPYFTSNLPLQIFNWGVFHFGN